MYVDVHKLPPHLDETPMLKAGKTKTALQLDVFGSYVNVLPSTAVEPISLGPAFAYCTECETHVLPVPLSDPNQGWIPFPCHQQECGGCFAYKGLCDDCNNCPECCECLFCGHCGGNTTDDGTCAECDRCSNCCECFVCDYCESRDRYGENYCTECDRCNSCCQCPTSCECESAHRSFRFPANGAGTIGNDERLTVDSPSGTISREGMRAIANLVHETLRTDTAAYTESAYHLVLSMDPIWQAKRGNFPRRLSSELHKKLGVKLPPNVISEVGNLARAHTSSSHSSAIELTRDLNLSAADFYNEESCWWGSHSFSRCSFKELGGIGMTTFGGHGNVKGRAWIQPLNDNLEPTDDAIRAHAYVVYNGYGDLSGYEPARMVAYLTGRTYAKIELYITGQYVNGNKGFLVADQATCDAIALLDIDGSCEHADR